MNKDLKNALKECFTQPMIGEKIQYGFYRFSENTEIHIVNITDQIIKNIDSDDIDKIILQCMQDMCQYSYIKGYSDGLVALKDYVK